MLRAARKKEIYPMQVQVAGLPWFAEDDYESFRKVLPLRHWHATYAEWLRAAEETKKRIKQSGVRAIEAHVRSDAFVLWCKQTGRHVDTKALLDFGNEVALLVHMGGKAH
jgi:hypothetical protein